MRRRDQGIVGLYEEELLSVNHHPDKFVGHKHCVSGDTNIPVNGVILPKMWDAHPLLCIPAYFRPPILLPLKHVACHGFKHKILE